jgi:hypothetical protein
MPDKYDLGIAERLLDEKYDMNVLFIDEDGSLREQESVSITATGIVDKVANGIAKIKLTNIKIQGENKTTEREGFAGMLRKSIQIRIDL